jgi:hypothetical protein
MCDKILQSIQNDWFSWLVAAIGSLLFVWSEVALLGFLSEGKNLSSSDLEKMGTGAVLFGAMWTALGAHLSKSDVHSLDTLTADRQTLEIVRMLKSASNFSTWGAVFILIGTMLLLVK